MSSVYITIDGDRLDRICRRKYGSERNGSVEMVLLANRGLAELGFVYDAGLEITLPDMPKSKPRIVKSVRLWT